MSEQLCFKETIIVGKVESNASVAPSPDPVGGICLNIQKAKGSHPLNRQIPNTNDNEIIAEEIKEIGRLFSGLFIYIKNNKYAHSITNKLSTLKIIYLFTKK